MFRTLVFLLAVLAAGCVSVRLPPDEEKRIQNVAVVNLVPDEIRLQRIGMTVFNNDMAIVPMEGIGAAIEAAIKNGLASARPQWASKDVTYDRALLAKKINSGGMAKQYLEERIENELQDIARLNQLDALIVVNTQRLETVAGDGVGLWLRSGAPPKILRALVHSNVSVAIAGANGKVLAIAVGLPEDPKSVDPREFGLSYDLSENNRPEIVQRLRPEIIDHLKRSIGKRLEQLNVR